MTARQIQSVASLLLTMLLVVAGCGKNVVDPPPPPLTQEQADSMATRAGDELVRAAVIDQARGLLVPLAAAERRPRVANRGAVSQDSSRFDYQITCYGLDGREVDWATTSVDSIDRLVLRWEYYVHTEGQESGWTWRWHWQSRGGFDFRGFSSASAEYRLDGVSRDSVDYAWLWESASSDGRGRSETSYHGVRLGKDYFQQRYPLGGRVAFQMDAHWKSRGPEGNRQEDLSADVEVRYNGSRYAELIVVGIYHYRLDLDTGEATPLPA